MKRMIAAGMATLLLLYMTTASASTPGTAADPLVTLSYLTGAYSDFLGDEVSKTLGDATAAAMGKIDESYAKYAGYSFVPSFTRITLSANDTVVLSMGGSFVLLSGTAALNSVSGMVINISNGRAVAAGENLIHNQRYFCTEDTTAVILATSASVAYIDGHFHSDNGRLNRPHSVFIDVMEDDWFCPAVDYVYRTALFDGSSANTFSPNNNMTRGMLATVLYRLDGTPEVGAGLLFSDVTDTSAYYYDPITWASSINLVQGHGDGTFGPDDPITREQMATFLYRYAGYKGFDTSAPVSAYDSFPDTGEVSGFAVDAFRWAVSRGIVNGSDGRILPRNTATRAHLAQIVVNFIYVTTV